MKKQTMIVIAAGGVCIIGALAIILVSLLRGASGTTAAGKTFMDGTTVNGLDVSGMDAEEAAAALAGRTEGYTFTLKLGEDSYTATGQELGMSYNEATDIQALLDAQSENQQLEITVEDLYTYDVTGFVGQVEADYNAQVAEAQAQAETLAAQAGQDAGGEADTAASEESAEGETAEEATQETTVDPGAPVNAYLTYDTNGTTFIIVPDQPGTDVDWTAVTEQVQAAVLAMEPELTLDLDDLVEQAELRADDPELQAALEEANSYLDLELTYTFTPEGGSTTSETIGRDVLGSIYYVDPEDLSVQVDEEILGSYVSSLADAHSVAGQTTKFKTTGGSYININVTSAGQSVDTTALYNDMLECLQTKTGGTRTAPYVEADDSADGYWGGNYVEINLTSQHLWLYRNGECILSCDVVSGCVANNTTTPTGCFTIFAKNTDRYLNGSNIDGTSYHTWVNYFMPFSGGCGIHDATWRSVFGGSEYLYNGSHGCVGVSLSNAKTIYNNVSVGTHVVVYGGASSDNLPAREQTVTATAASSDLVIGDHTCINVTAQTTPQFSSSNPAVATVDASGNVSAVGAGTAVITVYCPAGNNYGEASATVTITVREPTHVHTWVEQTTTVHHDAVYEEKVVVDQEAWDETVTIYRCSNCGAGFDTKDECLAHIAAGASSSSSSSGCAGASCVEDTEVIHHEAVTHTEQVLVQEAWDETVVTGYVCSGCGATKGPNDP